MAAINPTNLTPPRVALIDERSGAISREWYRFFLSLLTATQNNQDETSLAPDANALLASYDAVFGIAIQGLESAPDGSTAAADVDAKVNALAQAVGVMPRAELGTMAALQQANLPWFTFNTAPAPVPTAVGSVYWDGGTTVGVQMTTNVLGRVNEDLYHYIKASSAITKGQVVMFTGAVGSSGVVTGAPATGVTNGSYIMGVAAENIALNGFGLVQYNGTLKGLDTSAFLDGDILWYNPAVTGGLTKTEPTAPNVKVQVAAVINAGSGGSGSILIRVTAGSVLGGTDSNVQFGTLANGDLIQYDSTLQYWKNVTPASVLAGAGGAPVTKTADFTVAAGETWIINNKSGSTCTVTLPSASTNTGRTLTFQNYQDQYLVSASSNVVPQAGGSAGTAILENVSGNWATLVSNGTNWVIMQAAPFNIMLL